MKAWKIVVSLVVIGIVGAWVGYWIGHALGWTSNAEFPLRIGGGDWAIGLSGLLRDRRRRCRRARLSLLRLSGYTRHYARKRRRLRVTE